MRPAIGRCFLLGACVLLPSVMPGLKAVRRCHFLVALALLATMSGCTSPPASESRSESRSPVRNSEPRHSLERDEAAGGHTLRKHVGRTDAELRERLQRERHISAASTWTDRESAEAAVGAALARQGNKILPWLARESGHPNLVLDYDGDPTRPFGRTMRRGDDSSQPCAHAIIVLKWDGPTSYHVLTAYPECRS